MRTNIVDDFGSVNLNHNENVVFLSDLDDSLVDEGEQLPRVDIGDQNPQEDSGVPDRKHFNDLAFKKVPNSPKEVK